jgi:flagellar hook-basal body complex protein FliE
MRIDPIVPDTALAGPAVSSIPANGTAFGRLVDAAGEALTNADAAEAAFTHGKGGIQEMVVARAQADITLAIAATGAQRAAQALNTLLGMQI